MKARVAHLTGGRAGTEHLVWKSYATLGRHPQADVRLDPDTDLVVSARHAALVWHDGVWHIRDLGSTNGTYVDGGRVHGEAALRVGAVVQLGRDGPTFRFDVVEEPGAPEPVHTTDLAAGHDPDALETLPRIPVILAGGREVPLTPLATPAPPPPRRWPAVALLTLVLAVAGSLSLALARPDHDVRTMRADLLRRADGAFDALDALPRAMPLLAGPAREAQARVARLRSRVRRATDPAVLAALGDSLAVADGVRERLARAALLDVPGLLRGGSDALARVEARFADGRVVTVPAVAVRGPDGRTRYLALRSLLLDDLGSPPAALRVHGAGGRVVPATLHHGSAASGVALLAPAADAGTTPMPLAAARPAAPGQATLVVGLEARAATARLATVTEVGAGALHLDPLGETVPLGSVVLDEAGGVLGLVLPGDDASSAVRAVPAADLLRLVEGPAGAS